MKEWMVFVLLAVVALLALASLRGPVGGPVQSPASQLSFTIMAEKAKLLVGEPLKLIMHVRNETKDELQLQFSFSFRCAHDLGVAISSDGGKTFQPYFSMAMYYAWVSLCEPPLFALKPGEERQGEEFIGFHLFPSTT